MKNANVKMPRDYRTMQLEIGKMTSGRVSGLPSIGQTEDDYLARFKVWRTQQLPTLRRIAKTIEAARKSDNPVLYLHEHYGDIMHDLNSLKDGLYISALIEAAIEEQLSWSDRQKLFDLLREIAK